MVVTTVASIAANVALRTDRRADQAAFIRGILLRRR